MMKFELFWVVWIFNRGQTLQNLQVGVVLEHESCVEHYESVGATYIAVVERYELVEITCKLENELTQKWVSE